MAIYSETSVKTPKRYEAVSISGKISPAAILVNGETRDTLSKAKTVTGSVNIKEETENNAGDNIYFLVIIFNRDFSAFLKSLILFKVIIPRVERNESCRERDAVE